MINCTDFYVLVGVAMAFKKYASSAKMSVFVVFFSAKLLVIFCLFLLEFFFNLN